MLSRLIQWMSWLGRFELTTLVLIAAVAGGVWVFVEVADEVLEGNTRALDEAIILAMRERDDPADPRGPQWLEEVGRDVTALGGVAVLTLLTLASAGYLLLLQKRHAAVLLLITVVGGQALGLSLKHFFHRPRPDLVSHESLVYTASFPSGHSMMAAVTYLTLAAMLMRFQARRRLKAYVLVLATLLTLLVGISRVYMGVHWPTDVLAGWSLGGTWAVLCWLIALWLQKRGQVEQEASPELLRDS